MAVIKPFKGIHYNSDRGLNLGDLITPPYDVIGQDKQEILHKKSAYNIIRLEYGLSKPGDDESENRYSRAADTLSNWLKDHLLITDNNFSYYLYEQSFDFNNAQYRRRGLVAALKLEEYSAGVVLPHEKTMTGPKKDRLELLKYCRANISPIFTLFPDPEGTAAGIYNSVENEPLLFDVLEDSGHSHRVWSINDPAQQNQLTNLLANKPLLIADGHHRYETALNYCNLAKEVKNSGAAYILAVLVSIDDPGLLMLPTHRLLHSMSEAQNKLLLKRVDEEFTLIDRGDLRQLNHDLYLSDLKKNADKGSIGFLYGNKAALLLPKTFNPKSDLPVAILHERLLKPVVNNGHPDDSTLGILSFSHQLSRAVQEVVDNADAAAFILNTLPVGSVLDRALHGQVMPQKSTYFYPKLPGGLILHHHDLSH